MYLSIQISVCLSGRQSGRQTDTQTDRHAHACTHPSINLPVRLYISLQYLLYSIPCHAMLPVFCAAHVISSHFILSCLASFYLTHHFISSIFFLSLHLYIAWHYILLFDARCLHMYIIYIYIICPCRGRSAERALIAQGATFQLNTALESNVTSHDIRQADSTRQWKAHDFGNECG